MLSLVLLIFGIGYMFDSPAIVVSLGIQGHWLLGLLGSAVMLIVGGAMAWWGIKLRRVPKNRTFRADAQPELGRPAV